MTNGNNDDDDSRHDLTRIEDLSEFMHEEDPELEDIFGDFNKAKASGTSTDLASGLDLNELQDLETEADDLPPALPETAEEDFGTEAEAELSEISFGEPDQEISFESSSFDSPEDSDTLDDSPFELSDDATDSTWDSVPETADEEIADQIAEEETEEPEAFEAREEQPRYTPPVSSPEKFEEVQNFAQNFSYGQIEGGGNPPFSIIIRHLKYESDAEDILIMLREFGLVTDQNTQETQKALELGSLLIPQISEYSAIILAHKLRRFDLDLEVGLSDEVHPSKSGEVNPRGLMKKDSLRQNKIEQFKKDEEDTPSKEIIVSTTATLEGHIIKKYIGVQTSFAIVDEEELERLKFVQKTQRAHTELHQYETEEVVSSERAFKDYQNSFELLFTDLCDQLKVKAIKEKANALLGLNYQLTSLPFQKSEKGSNCYQLTCSATLAVVRLE